jgi:hypothetical protein
LSAGLSSRPPIVETTEKKLSSLLDRGNVDDEVITRATAAGLSQGEILEIVAECAFGSLVGCLRRSPPVTESAPAA